MLSPELAFALAVWVGWAWSGFMTTLSARGGVGGPSESRCPRCRTVIPTVLRLPLVGWIICRGRCRHCAVRVDPAYLQLELATFAMLVIPIGIGVLHMDPLRTSLFGLPGLGAAAALVLWGVRGNSLPVYLLTAVTAVVAGALPAAGPLSPTPGLIVALACAGLALLPRLRWAAFPASIACLAFGTVPLAAVAAAVFAPALPVLARRLHPRGTASQQAR